MPKPKNWLRMKSIDRIALVDKGDNPTANIVIHKRRAPVAKADGLTFAETFGATRVNQDLWQYTDALGCAIRNAMESDSADKAGLIQTSIEQFAAAMKDAVPTWTAGESTEKGDKMENTEKAGLLKTIMKALGFKDDEIAKVAPGEPAPATPPANPPAPPAPENTVDKSALEALEKRAKDAEDAAAKAAERIQKLEDERELSVYITKARSYANIPGLTADDFAPVLRKIGKALADDEFKKLEKVLRAADQAIEKAKLFGEIGSDGEGDAGSAMARATAKAEELRKADPKLTAAAALAQVFKADPGLAAEVEDEDAEEETRRKAAQRRGR